MTMDNDSFDRLLAEYKDKNPTVLHEKTFIREVPALGGKYKLKITPIFFGEKYWNFLAVEILDSASDKKIGEYLRNYGKFYDTFWPFVKDGKEYAIYSRSYTSTRVMSLPDCADLGGEEPSAMGFCPVEFFVPEIDRYDRPINEPHGFVAGCIWGDDSSWKVQYLNLRDVENGVIRREQKFGYLELDDNRCLRDSVDLYGKHVRITTQIEFDLDANVNVSMVGTNEEDEDG